MTLLRWGLVCSLAFVCLSREAAALTTSEGQAWNFKPDAWIRANDSNTSWFGWDVLEEANAYYPPPPPPGSFTRVLDDNTPDLGAGTTAVGPRLYQNTPGAETNYGHQYLANYYARSDFSNDFITATAPAGGIGGYTTVVMQAIGMDGEPTEGISFEMADAGWTKSKNLYGQNGLGSGLYLVEWFKEGGDLPFSIHMTSTLNHRSFDAFQVDTFWTPESSPRLNSISQIPEPASVVLALCSVVGCLFFSRKRILA